MTSTNTDQQLVQTLTGQETWPQGTWKLHVFALHYPGDGKYPEQSLLAASKAEAPITLVSKNGSTHSKESRKKELGYWTNSTFGIPEGTILKVYAYRSARFGERPFTVNQLVRVRRNADYQMLSLELSATSDKLQTEAFIKGRFDLLTVEEAETFGMSLNPRKRAQLLKADLGDRLKQTVIEAGVEPQEFIRTTTVPVEHGEERVVTTRRRKRSMG